LRGPLANQPDKISSKAASTSGGRLFHSPVGDHEGADFRFCFRPYSATPTSYSDIAKPLEQPAIANCSTEIRFAHASFSEKCFNVCEKICLHFAIMHALAFDASARNYVQAFLF